ncbi:PIN domain-containing protein [uncultured Jannaschia sp.]|uniref:PIN domain-containing protein n=1 Tax=uncultured Jannaschia sp. TaxID=293347 RepID=UPI00263242FC|nr:PIN domain-containing protein [uncultured Jannaschia sp.]
MAACVADTSALLAYLLDEPGAAVTAGWLDRGAVVSTLNVQELVSKIVRDGGTEALATGTVADLALAGVHDLTADLAAAGGAMIAATRPFGLSHGDRACLALARHLGLPAVTADRAWADVAEALAVRVELVR